MTCNCDSCKESRKFEAVISHLDKTGEFVHAQFLQTLYSNYVHQSMDLEYMNLIRDNKWPSAEEIMAAYGWYRKDEEPKTE